MQHLMYALQTFAAVSFWGGVEAEFLEDRRDASKRGMPAWQQRGLLHLT